MRGGGCCANLPVFFSQNSGLVAVVARESASILPETMEDSLCSLLAAAPEVKVDIQYGTTVLKSFRQTKRKRFYLQMHNYFYFIIFIWLRS